MGFEFLTRKKILKLESFVDVYNFIIEVIAEFNKRFPGAEQGTEEMLLFLCDEFQQVDTAILKNIEKIYSNCGFFEGPIICVAVALCGASKTIVTEQSEAQLLDDKSIQQSVSLFFANDHAKKSLKQLEGSIVTVDELLMNLIRQAFTLLNSEDPSAIQLGALLMAGTISYQYAITQDSVQLVLSSLNCFFQALESKEFQCLENIQKETVKILASNTTRNIIDYLQEMNALPDLAPSSKCTVL